MPRGSLSHKDAMQMVGFKEGTLLIEKSVVAVHQFPPNKTTGVQGDPFTCVKWTGTKLDKDLNVIDGEEAVTIQLRLGKVENIRPGMLKEKDWDDTDVVPKDLGADVDTEGNSVFIEDGQRAEGSGWAKMEESLVKCGLKEAVAAKGVATLYEGMVVHLLTVEGDKYIAKKGAKAGQEVIGYNLVADRIYRHPGDKTGKVKVGGTEATSTKAKVNGKADEDEKGDGGDSSKLVKTGATVLESASAKFKTEMYTGKAVDVKKFKNALVKELMKQDVDEEVQGALMEFLKTGAGLKALGKEVGFKVGEDSVTFVEE